MEITKVSKQELPKSCCFSVSSKKFKPCGETAIYWYHHGNDICSYCEEHNFPCGKPILSENK